MHCPMCDSAYVGEAGLDMIGLVSWRCLECRFIWWLTAVPVEVFAAAAGPVAWPAVLETVPAAPQVLSLSECLPLRAAA